MDWRGRRQRGNVEDRRGGSGRFTHGSSAQRVQWFSEGLKNGDFNRCDTFSAR